MGRIGISYQDVAKAISTLQSLQKNPTVDHIREVMGTGSKSTIARFLREWKAKHGLIVRRVACRRRRMAIVGLVLVLS